MDLGQLLRQTEIIKTDRNAVQADVQPRSLPYAYPGVLAKHNWNVNARVEYTKIVTDPGFKVSHNT